MKTKFKPTENKFSEPSSKMKKTEIGMIPEDWDVKSIHEVAEVVGGGTPSTKNPEYWEGTIAWITPRDLSTFKFRYIKRGERNITIKGLENSSAKLLPQKTVLLTTRAPVGYLAIADNKVTTNQGFHSLIPNNRTTPEFLFYLLKRNVEMLKSNASGTTFGELSGSRLKAFKFAFPDVQEQDSIAKILSDLDSKIELNQQMNKTLETIGQAIFKKWFIDFEFPNKKGKPYKSSGGEMVDSELGKIPKGWELGKFNHILREIVSGSRPKGGIDSNEIDIPSIGAENINGIANHDYSKEKYISREFFNNMNQGVVKNNDVLMYKDGAKIGRISFFDYDYPHKNCAINEHVFILRTNERITPEYLFLWLDIPKMTQSIINLNSNAAQPGINQTQVKTLPILIPNRKILNQFNFITKILFHKIFENAKQNQNLSQVRDSLIPRLMSGKIRVK